MCFPPSEEILRRRRECRPYRKAVVLKHSWGGGRWGIFGPVFHNNGNLHRISAHYLHQRVGNVGMTDEAHSIHSSAHIHGIDGSGIYFLDAPLRTADGHRCRLRNNFADGVALSKSADYAGMNWDFARQTLVESKMKLAGNNLHHF